MRRTSPTRGGFSAGFLFTVLLAACLLGTGCAPSRIGRLKLDDDVELPERSVVIFLVDGLDLTTMDRLAAQGRLPNIQNYFIDGGVRVRNTVTGIPSVTYPNCTSAITGVFPGHHGIMGNFWFDRHSLQTRYYMKYDTYRSSNVHFIAPTIFEILNDHFTVSIQAHTRRGVGESIDNRGFFGYAWFLQQWTWADTYVALRFEDVGELADDADRWPSIVLTYYPGVDETAHRNGADSPEYEAALENIDNAVGIITGDLERVGLDRRTYLVLMTDHCHVPIPPNHATDMAQWLRAHRGLKVRSEPFELERYDRRLALLNSYDVIGGIDSDRVARFYVRPKQGWAHTPSYEQILDLVTRDPAMTDEPAVQMAVIRAGPNRVQVLSREGVAFIERREGRAEPEYRVVSERGDPVHLSSSSRLESLARSGWHGSRAWLEASADADFPDFVPQVVEMFDSRHTGDIVLFAAKDWSFDVVQRGGHGSIWRRDMHIPLFFSGPDLPRGAEIGPGRQVDVVPTIIGLLGEQDRLRHYRLDGIDLSERLRTATPAARTQPAD